MLKQPFHWPRTRGTASLAHAAPMRPFVGHYSFVGEGSSSPRSLAATMVGCERAMRLATQKDGPSPRVLGRHCSTGLAPGKFALAQHMARRSCRFDRRRTRAAAISLPRLGTVCSRVCGTVQRGHLCACAPGRLRCQHHPGTTCYRAHIQHAAPKFWRKIKTVPRLPAPRRQRRPWMSGRRVVLAKQVHHLYAMGVVFLLASGV